MKALLGSVLMFALAGLAVAQSSSKPAATVNGEAIPRSEVEAVLKLRPQAVTPLTAAQQRDLFETAAQLLIDEALMRQFLNKSAPPADMAEVDKQFTALLKSLKTNGKTLAEFCKESQQTERQIRTGMELASRWNGYLANKLTDAELEKYYVENKDFFDKVTVKCSHVLYRMSPEAPAAEKSDMIKRMRDLRQQIIDGQMSFVDAAKTFSQCPSGPKGGNLGYIHRKWMVDEAFAKAAFSLKVNEISDVVVTDFGLHLILVTDRKPPEASEFAKIKDEVRDSCGEEMRQKLLETLRKAAKIEIHAP